jgi:hypothetical protein
VNYEQQPAKIVYWLQLHQLYRRFAMQPVRVPSCIVAKGTYESVLLLQSDYLDFVIQFQWAPR